MSLYTFGRNKDTHVEYVFESKCSMNKRDCFEKILFTPSSNGSLQSVTTHPHSRGDVW